VNVRRYTLKRRAERQADTKRRIVEAAVDLHGSVGPSLTTVAEIARRAGVQRLTVYSHFPDERSLFQACTTHWFGDRPLPNPAEWPSVDGVERWLLHGLKEVYGYYRRNQQMISNWLRDAEIIPTLKEFAEAGYYGYLENVAQAILESLPPREEPLRLKGLLLVTLHFETWRSLTSRSHLSGDDAAQTMLTSIMALEREAGTPAAQA
jgi:AcrR family transcriptional regulator